MWQYVAEMLSESRSATAVSRIWRGSRPQQIPAEVFRDHQKTMFSTFENEVRPHIYTLNLKDVEFIPTTSIGTSTTTFKNLERTDISQLCLGWTATGQYVLVRCIEKSILFESCTTVVEDHVGNVCSLNVCNYPPEEPFSPGTVLIVKEPYFLTRDNNLYGIFCYCPTDILVLRPSHPLFPLSKTVRWIHELRGTAIDPLVFPKRSSALKWKERGNCFFDKNEMVLARDAYFLGLGLCKDDDVEIKKLLKLNILAVHLKLKYYEKAIELGNEILEHFPNEKKALFRLGKTYYAVRKFEKAFKCFEKFCQQFPDEKEGTDEFRRVRERIKERNGEFDVEKLRRLAKENPLKKIDCADYDSLVEIKDIVGRNRRSLFLTKDVKKGAILMVSKALAATLNLEEIFSTVEDDKIRKRNSAVVILQLVHMISKNPNLFGPPIFTLYSGINSSNVHFQLFCDPELKQEPTCDPEKLRTIFEQNNFRIVNGINGGIKGTGLFMLPSYLNISSEFNVDYKFYNDVMVFTAVADLKAGTELTIRYPYENWDHGLRTMFLNAGRSQAY